MRLAMGLILSRELVSASDVGPLAETRAAIPFAKRQFPFSVTHTSAP